MNNWEKIINKITHIIDGFKLKNYEYELPYEPIYSSVDFLLLIGNKIDALIKHLSDLPISEVNFGMKSYSIRKVNSSAIRNTIAMEGRCLSYTKVCVENFTSSHYNEIEVLNTIYSLGIDGEIWEFRFNPNMLYKCSSKVFENEIATICCDFTKLCIEALKLNMIVKYRLEPGDIYTDKITERHFEGKVTTYGKFEDSMIYGIKEILPNPYENISKHYQEAIHIKPVDDLINEENLIVDVVRKGSGKRITESFKKAMQEFNIDIMSGLSVGEVNDASEDIRGANL